MILHLTYRIYYFRLGLPHWYYMKKGTAGVRTQLCKDAATFVLLRSSKRSLLLQYIITKECFEVVEIIKQNFFWMKVRIKTSRAVFLIVMPLSTEKHGQF